MDLVDHPVPCLEDPELLGPEVVAYEAQEFLHRHRYLVAVRLVDDRRFAAYDRDDPGKRSEIKRIEKQDLLILDDFGLQPLDNISSLTLMEIIEDRFAKKSIIIGSQLPLEKWYDIITEKTVADAILDRLLNASHKITLKGDSLRRKKR